MDLSKTGKWLIGVGIVLLVLSLVLPAIIGRGYESIFGPIAVIFSVWWLFLIAGIGLLIAGRTNIGTLTLVKTLRFYRQDIIKSTNWIRANKIEFRRTLGIGLIAAGIIPLILELIWRTFSLLFIWLILIVIGVIWVILAWWIPYLITHDYTHKIFVRIPDIFSLHTFHTNLRQCAEDVGYGISEDVSPGESSSSSSYNNNIFLLKGGFKAIKRPFSPSKSLFSGLAEIPLFSDVLNVSTLSIFLMMLGGTLMIHGMSVWMGEDWGLAVGIIGILLLLIGICVFVYDYLTRTRKWGEIYVAEEGTVYIPTANIYDPKLLERIQFRAEPNISASQTSCELAVTIGARCTKFFDAKELESDFKTIADSIEKIAGENKLEVKGVFTKEAGEA